jgi:hypothetical protein
LGQEHWLVERSEASLAESDSLSARPFLRFPSSLRALRVSHAGQGLYCGTFLGGRCCQAACIYPGAPLLAVPHAPTYPRPPQLRYGSTLRVLRCTLGAPALRLGACGQWRALMWDALMNIGSLSLANIVSGCAPTWWHGCHNLAATGSEMFSLTTLTSSASAQTNKRHTSCRLLSHMHGRRSGTTLGQVIGSGSSNNAP